METETMKKTAVCQLALGQTRVNGYLLYAPESMAFEEHTPKETKQLIKAGEVNGLCLDNHGEIQLDEEDFRCHNLMVKSGVGNFRPLKSVDVIGNGNLFALTKVADTDRGRVYEIVSNLCARVPVTEAKVRALCQFGSLSGCWVDTDTDVLHFADGVEQIDLTTDTEAANYSRDEVGDWAEKKGSNGETSESITGARRKPLSRKK